MINRRSLVLGIVGAFAAPQTAFAHKAQKTFVLATEYQPQIVEFDPSYMPGTIVVDPGNRFLYFVEGIGIATRYGVGVGRAGLAWSGTAEIARKAKWPRWTPTPNMIKRDPGKYAKHAGGVPGGPGNPLGARALYLYRGGKDTFYRIHGTTEPWTIGRAVSNGCIRMLNEHVTELYERVPIGAPVVVLR